MCGLFGYAGTGAGAATLSQAAGMAGRRGPDAWGYWADGELVRKPGRLPPDAAAAAAGARLVVGHARLATMPGSLDTADAQPLIRGDVILAHNGSVWNYEDLSGGLVLATRNDSEALAACIDDGPLPEAVARAMERADLGDAFALAVARKRQVYLLARAQSLYTYAEDGGMYWCSVRVSESWLPVSAGLLLSAGQSL